LKELEGLEFNDPNEKFPNGYVKYQIFINETTYNRYLAEFEREKFESIKRMMKKRDGL